MNYGDFDINYGYVMLYDFFESNYGILDVIWMSLNKA